MSSAAIARLEILRDGLMPEPLIDTNIALTFEPVPDA